MLQTNYLYLFTLKSIVYLIFLVSKGVFASIPTKLMLFNCITHQSNFSDSKLWNRSTPDWYSHLLEGVLSKNKINKKHHNKYGNRYHITKYVSLNDLSLFLRSFDNKKTPLKHMIKNYYLCFIILLRFVPIDCWLMQWWTGLVTSCNGKRCSSNHGES